MPFHNQKIQIISAPSILGLKPGGVEELGNSLLKSGLMEALQTPLLPIHMNTLNHTYTENRDPDTQILNAPAIKEFSMRLSEKVDETLAKGLFPFFCGGDCSILTGIMAALKARGTYGLIFLDAHADFYLPNQSVTGEVADMDLALVTGRGPELLTNINNLSPYVQDEEVIHVGQRDQEETQRYGATDIRETAVTCYSLDDIRHQGFVEVSNKISEQVIRSEAVGFWIHYDTDVLSDALNPAVDYRLPDGLLFEEVEHLLHGCLMTGKITGISLTIFNPRLDKDRSISKSITASLGRAFRGG